MYHTNKIELSHLQGQPQPISRGSRNVHKCTLDLRRIKRKIATKREKPTSHYVGLIYRSFRYIEIFDSQDLY